MRSFTSRTLAASRPERAALEERAHRFLSQQLWPVTEARVEDAALAPLPTPRDGHDRPVLEARRRENLVRRVDVHVVLLGVHAEGRAVGQLHLVGELLRVPDELAADDTVVAVVPAECRRGAV